MERFKKLLLDCCGNTLENEREQTLISALSKRMDFYKISNYDAYHELILSNQAELHSLSELVTVNETYFFREPSHLNFLVDKLLPKHLASSSAKSVKILSAGCSTGEEPYSIAMMLRDRYGSDCEKLFSIYGIDIDSSAISRARDGVYARSSFRAIDSLALERHFVLNTTGEYRIRETIRNQTTFEVVNLLAGSYPEAIENADFIFYRNVSIYFPPEIQQYIFGRLAKLLNDNGVLFVGTSESIFHNIGILELVEENSVFYYRKKLSNYIADRRSTSRFSRNSNGISGNATVSRKLTADLSARFSPPKTVPALKSHQESSGGKKTGVKNAVMPDVREHFDKALSCAQNNKPADAIKFLDILIGQDASFSKAHTLKASVLLSESRYDEAMESCNKALMCDSLSLEAYLMLGIIERQKGDENTAITRFREALYLNPSCWLAHFHTAEILFSRREIKRSKSSYESTLRILEKGSIATHGQSFFPLSFNAEQFLVICKHKLSLLKENC